ncbi:MAG: alpha/beta hydrolase [Chloroflexi bacterium]|nr:alpha/beta hydrolase [Chloroflexota bacterium]
MTTVSVQEKHITINGVRLRYFDYGNEGKLPLICLHGHTGQAHIWDEFAEAMAPSYHVLTIDQRGHGESEWAASGYDRDRFVEDLTSLIDALGFQRVVLAGLSMGGWNSLLYTAAHPDRVERIIIVDIGPESSEESKRQWGSQPPTPSQFATFEEAVASALRRNPWVTPDRLRGDVRDRLRQQGDGTWTWKADPELTRIPLRDGSDPDLIARYWRALETIPCPILEVKGKESPLLDGALLQRMQETGRQFQWVEIAGAGHVVTVDKPQEFIRATRAFLGA